MKKAALLFRASQLKAAPVHALVSVAIAILWLALVLPSAFIAALFTLDMGGIFEIARKFPQNLDWILSPYTGSGRYFPLYWLYHVLLSSVFGFDVRGYYLVLAVIFLLGALLVGRLCAKLVPDRSLGVLVAASLFISSPNIEAVSVIGKAEPFVFLFAAAIVLIFHRAIESGQTLSLSACAVIASLFTCSLWFKETSIALFAFPAAGVAATWALNRAKGALTALSFTSHARMFAALVVGLIASKLPYVFAHSAAGGRAQYTTFRLTREVVWDNITFYLTEQPDVTLIGGVATVLVGLTVARASSGRAKLDDAQRRALVCVVALVACSWCYCAAFLIWRWSMAYYLFLPAILFRVAAGYGLYVTARFAVGGPRLRLVACGLMALSLAHAAVYMWYAGAAQIAFTRVYTEAIRRYVSVSKPGDSLSFESYPFYSEQVTNTAQLMQAIFNENRRLYGIADLIDPAIVTPEVRELLALTDADLAANEKNYPKTDDYVIALTGDELATWHVRGVSPYYSEGSFLNRERSYEMQQIAESRVYFPAVFLNVWTLRPEFRNAYVGYEIYRVKQGPRFLWFGRYPDGWIGRAARLVLYPERVRGAIAHISTSKHVPVNAVTVFRDDVLVERAVLKEGSEHSFRLTPSPGEAAVFRFEVERAFVPKSIGMGKDKRELGALVWLEPLLNTSK